MNVRVAEKEPLSELPAVQEEIRKAESEFDGKGRILVRFSGTETLARVMVEGEDQDEVDATANRIAERFEPSSAVSLPASVSYSFRTSSCLCRVFVETPLSRDPLILYRRDRSRRGFHRESRPRQHVILRKRTARRSIPRRFRQRPRRERGEHHGHHDDDQETANQTKSSPSKRSPRRTRLILSIRVISAHQRAGHHHTEEDDQEPAISPPPSNARRATATPRPFHRTRTRKRNRQSTQRSRFPYAQILPEIRLRSRSVNTMKNQSNQFISLSGEQPISFPIFLAGPPATPREVRARVAVCSSGWLPDGRAQTAYRRKAGSARLVLILGPESR